MRQRVSHLPELWAVVLFFLLYYVVTERSQKRQEEERMHSVWVESLEQVRREDEWFKAANRGKDEDIEKMQDLIGEDPNRFYGDWDPRKLINSGRGGRLIGM